ncbi:hypothetical protein AVEN_201345-1 [Araneus ventricosus]|uniref:Uncharacterized protein n=1 Tax=Araneus ventricosus TaxID=182803 RepID=A0A4Y2M6C9_ARAVE|nr:hypothetical protein AVEN_201345-1 [Araneus ventricosus]
MNLLILNHGQMTRRTDTPTPSFRTTLAGGRFATIHDLGCNETRIRQIFGGIGFRTLNLPPSSREPTSRPPRPLRTTSELVLHP